MAKKTTDRTEQIKNAYENVSARVHELEARFEDRVRERPVQSVGIAFGAGIITGALLMAILKKR